MCLFVLIGSVKTYGSTANITVSSPTIGAGEEGTVTFTVSSDTNVGTFDLRITYDASVLEYVSGADMGGNGLVQILNSELSQTNSVSKDVVFRGIKEGASDLTVQLASSSVLDMGAMAMDLAGGTGSVTVGNSSNVSSDNKLTSLLVTGVDTDGNNQEVQFEPAFSPDVTEYKAEVLENIKKLSIAASVSDASSTTKVSGAKLTPGDNVTTVTVTAADGSVNEYKIYTVKAGGGEENSEGADAGADTGLAPVPEDLSPVFSNKTGKYIIQNFDTVGCPEGFTPFGFEFEDRTIAALSGFDNSVVLICLADDEAGGNAALFVYNRSKEDFSLYNRFTSENNYVMLTPESDVNIPEGMEETTVKINGIDTMAWQGGSVAKGSQDYLVYAVDLSGNKGFYVYHSDVFTFTPYEAASEPETTSDPSLQSKYDELQKVVDDDMVIRIEIIVCFLILCIILIIYIAFLLYKIKKLSPEEDEDIDDVTPVNNVVMPATKEPQKELKLDLAMKANEVRTEDLANDVQSILDNEDSLNTPDNETNDSAHIPENAEKTETSKPKNAEKTETSKPEDAEKIVTSKPEEEKKEVSLDDTSTDLGIVFVDVDNEK